MEIPDSMKVNVTQFSQEGSKLVWKIENLTEDKTITFKCKIDELAEKDKEKEYKVYITEKDDSTQETLKSNEVIFSLGKPELKITHECMNKTSEITEGDTIQYIYTVENISNYNVYDAKITDYLSEGIKETSIIYYQSDKEERYSVIQDEHQNEVEINIPAGKKICFEVTVKADYIDADAIVYISHYFTVKTDYQELTSTTIKHRVKEKEFQEDEKNKYVISGVTWLDSNQNGERESDEELLPNIQVVLLNETGNIVSKQITGENGEYQFNDIVQGNYIVAFIYDEKKYDVTTYKKDGTNTNKAMNLTLKIDGTNTNCGATDTINLNQNLYDINIGLVINEKFDLSLSKTITKVTVKTNEKTVTNNYNNSNLEKIEIKSKEINGAIVAIEYSIIVTNEGAITGKVNKIVDYLRDTDLKFNSELNSGWYLGTDGNLYNSTLNNTELKSGEKAEVKLVLTKTMTENNTGITNNTAEIYEAYNKEGKEDYDSTPANKIQNEDDTGNAEIIVGVKTGQVTYILFATLVTATMLAGLIILKKRI